jgi:hypothetical protein
MISYVLVKPMIEIVSHARKWYGLCLHGLCLDDLYQLILSQWVATEDVACEEVGDVCSLLHAPNRSS